jgi:hypothetical protein
MVHSAGSSPFGGFAAVGESHLIEEFETKCPANDVLVTQIHRLHTNSRMHDMDAGTLDLKTIFGQDRRHVVPLYQRPYVWEAKKQWEPLWNDVEAVTRRLLADQPTRAHFLGAIVLEQQSKKTGCLETRLVIDGQQRLTTLQLILEAFADSRKTVGAEQHHKALAKLTRNDDPMNDDPVEQFKVWPTSVDQEAFQEVMDCGAPAELRKRYGAEEAAPSVDHPIADAYLYFHRRIEDWFAEDPAAQTARLHALLATLREHIRLVVIDLGKEDDAQLIFEKLNARGTPLLPADLVKNHLFHKAQQAGLPIDDLYKAHWKPFDRAHRYWRKAVGRGQQSRAGPDRHGCRAGPLHERRAASRQRYKREGR